MTNATVSTLSAAPASVPGGQKLLLKYKGGEQTVIVPAGTPVVTFRPGNQDQAALVVPGAKVVITAREKDGKPTAISHAGRPAGTGSSRRCSCEARVAGGACAFSRQSPPRLRSSRRDALGRASPAACASGSTFQASWQSPSRSRRRRPAGSARS